MRESNIYIWGAGLYGEKTLQNCKESGINIVGFVDSNENLWNTKKFGLVIYSPKEVLQKQNVEILIAVANESVFMEINEICENAGTKAMSFQEFNQRIFNSGKYWEGRYAAGGNSGAGSYNRLAEFKAEILNDFVKKHSINSVIEFGCGDGNQLSLAQYPKYLGFDVSQTAINICKNKYFDDKTKEFRLLDAFSGEKAELTLSLDVIYHLIEDRVFENYMETLFGASTKFVIIYASNKTSSQLTYHVKHRKFTDWVEFNKKDWNLLKFIPNKYPAQDDNGNDPSTSFADFYIFENAQ